MQVKCARDISFDYGETMGITEDLHMFLRALSKGYKISHIDGFVRTGIPKDVQTMVDQRRRWAVGYILHILSPNVRIFLVYPHLNKSLSILPLQYLFRYSGI
jgi:cellulose synthase/poly-beta-1,6-N-acetylglucosamine synthase-like glycosyltransferase